MLTEFNEPSICLNGELQCLTYASDDAVERLAEVLVSIPWWGFGLIGLCAIVLFIAAIKELEKE